VEGPVESSFSIKHLALEVTNLLHYERQLVAGAVSYRGDDGS